MTIQTLNTFNPQELDTWERLQSLNMPGAEEPTPFPFAARLARENGWTREFANRAITEYRKFCFLTVHAGHGVTPSDQVDQVWHLHMLYSWHYWHELCGAALTQPLHHQPTKGGASESSKYNDWYGRTLDSYRRYFGEPPADLWPSAKERFDKRHAYMRIDRREVFVINRKRLWRGLALLFGAGVILFTVTACSSSATDLNAGSIVFAGFLSAVIVFIFRWAEGENKGGNNHNDRSGGSCGGGGGCGGCGGCGG
ncbi:MAG: hypothetical protein LBE21_11190 [Pseudomonadales bacterium]|jgi:hypothetical protein|nr:hypothetical protein [Pseudomonadales bacterium]